MTNGVGWPDVAMAFLTVSKTIATLLTPLITAYIVYRIHMIHDEQTLRHAENVERLKNLQTGVDKNGNDKPKE